MVVGIIQARMGSTRFPGKTLIPINGEPMLQMMLRRVARSRRLDRYLVATTDSPADEPIVACCRTVNVEVFRGSDTDVLDRYYRAACAAGAQVVVRLTADCPLIDWRVIDDVVEVFQDGTYDYVSNAAPPPSSYPDGMDVEVISMDVLTRAWATAVKPSEREHVTFCLWQHPETFRIRRVDASPDRSAYRLTVDRQEDLAVVEGVVRALGPQAEDASLDELVTCLQTHPELLARNQHIPRNEGWQSAFALDRLAGW